VSFPRQALAELVAQLGGVAQCKWVDVKTPQLGATGQGEAWIELAITSDAGQGDGEYRQTPDPKNPTVFLNRVVLPSLVTVTMRAKSYDAKLQAGEILKAVRWKLRTVTAGAFYAATNTAMVRTHPIAIFHGAGAGNRTRLDASMDVVFSHLDGGVPKDDAGGTFGTASPVPFVPSS